MKIAEQIPHHIKFHKFKVSKKICENSPFSLRTHSNFPWKLPEKTHKNHPKSSHLSSPRQRTQLILKTVAKWQRSLIKLPDYPEKNCKQWKQTERKGSQ